MITKIMATGTIISGSSIMLAVIDSANTPWLEGGAIAILAIFIFYSVTKLIPSAMQQRQDEMKAFIATVEKISSDHVEERREWRQEIQQLTQAINKASQVIEKNYGDKKIS